MTNLKKESNSLVGKFFHSMGEDRETIKWQGYVKQVVKRSSDGLPELYQLQLFEWIMGFESDEIIVPVSDMTYWCFYESAEEMNERYKQYKVQGESEKLWQEENETLRPH